MRRAWMLVLVAGAIAAGWLGYQRLRGAPDTAPSVVRTGSARGDARIGLGEVPPALPSGPTETASMDDDARRTVCMAACAEPKTYAGCITRCGATPNLQPGGQLAAIAGAQPGALGDALAKFWQTGELSDDLKAASDPSGMFKLRYFRVSHADGDELMRTWGEPHETIADAMHVWRDPAAKTMVAMGMSPNRVTLVPTPYQTFADILGLQGELLGMESHDWLSEATSPTEPHVAGATRLPGDNPTYLLPFTTERANPIMLSILMTGGKASAIHLNFLNPNDGASEIELREVVAQALAAKARANRFVLSADGGEMKTPSRIYTLTVVQGSIWLVVAKR